MTTAAATGWFMGFGVGYLWYDMVRRRGFMRHPGPSPQRRSYSDAAALQNGLFLHVVFHVGAFQQ